jgi:hypothetical protein
MQRRQRASLVQRLGQKRILAERALHRQKVELEEVDNLVGRDDAVLRADRVLDAYLEQERSEKGGRSQDLGR